MPKPVFVEAWALSTWWARARTPIRANPIRGKFRIAAIGGERILSLTTAALLLRNIVCSGQGDGIRPTWGGPVK